MSKSDRLKGFNFASMVLGIQEDKEVFVRVSDRYSWIESLLEIQPAEVNKSFHNV